MKRLVALMMCAVSLGALAQITYPYNPDGNADGDIAVGDLQDFLVTYGGAFTPAAIVVDSVELGKVLDSLQVQIDAFRCGDDVLHEGYWYNTTSIGGQCWFAENLCYLPEVSPSADGSDVNPHAYVYGYQGGDVSAAQNTLEYYQFGALYNFPAVAQWDLCPAGWHIPSDGEWSAMTGSIIGGSQNTATDTTYLVSPCAAAVMKKSFPNNQIDENEILHDKFWLGTNSSGFSGLPGGWKHEYGYFDNKGLYGYWWTSSSQDSGAWYRILSYDDDSIIRDNYFSSLHAFSIRCIKDSE